jgi:hypothetical protein
MSKLQSTRSRRKKQAATGSTHNASRRKTVPAGSVKGVSNKEALQYPRGRFDAPGMDGQEGTGSK